MSKYPWPSPVETEGEWLSCTDPEPMLMFLRGNSSDRKHCLFEAACCRRIWRFLCDDCTKDAIEVLERYAGDETLFEEVAEANERVDAICNSHISERFRDATWAVYWATMKPCEDDLSACEYAASAVSSAAKKARSKAKAAERAAQAVLLREIIGNPFRPIIPSWRTSTVLALTTGIYEEIAFDQMPILADALQDAGCDNEDMLNHLRGPGSHYRGCWVLDLPTRRK